MMKLRIRPLAEAKVIKSFCHRGYREIVLRLETKKLSYPQITRITRIFYFGIGALDLFAGKGVWF